MNDSRRTWTIVVALYVCCIAIVESGRAGIPEPPMVLFGNVVFQNGQPASSGNLEFRITTVNNQPVLTVNAQVAPIQEGVNFIARLPIESGVAETIQNALVFGNQYVIQAFLNGKAVSSPIVNQPFFATRGFVLGPFQLVSGESVGNSPTIVSVNPSAPQIAVGQSVHITIVAEDLDMDPIQFTANPLLHLSLVSFQQNGTTATVVIEYFGTQANVGNNVLQIVASDGKTQDSVNIPIQVGDTLSAPQPDLVYEFDRATLAEDGWAEIPGGFTSAVPGFILPTDFSFDPTLVPSSSDKKGLVINVQPGQVTFIFSQASFNTEGHPVLLRMSVRSDSPGAQVALVALKGGMSSGTVDGSIATHIPASAASMMTQERQMTLLYEPDGLNTINPAIQVASSSPTDPATILIDRLEIYKVRPTSAFPIALFDKNADMNPITVAEVSPPAAPAVVYEFDQATLQANNWKEIPGGFLGATAGFILPSGLTGSQIPSSVDKKGLVFLSRTGDVNFIFAGAPVDTLGFPVMLRATVQTDNQNAQVALVALRGDLNSPTGGVDGSIATLIPANSAGMAGQERKLTLIYEPDQGTTITPAFQVAGVGVQAQVTVYLDKIEVYRLNPAQTFMGSFFRSAP